jgi:hypothetical protein
MSGAVSKTPSATTSVFDPLQFSASIALSQPGMAMSSRMTSGLVVRTHSATVSASVALPANSIPAAARTCASPSR